MAGTVRGALPAAGVLTLPDRRRDRSRPAQPFPRSSTQTTEPLPTSQGDLHVGRVELRTRARTGGPLRDRESGARTGERIEYDRTRLSAVLDRRLAMPP